MSANVEIQNLIDSKTPEYYTQESVKLAALFTRRNKIQYYTLNDVFVDWCIDYLFDEVVRENSLRAVPLYVDFDVVQFLNTFHEIYLAKEIQYKRLINVLVQLQDKFKDSIDYIVMTYTHDLQYYGGIPLYFMEQFMLHKDDFNFQNKNVNYRFFSYLSLNVDNYKELTTEALNKFIEICSDFEENDKYNYDPKILIDYFNEEELFKYASEDCWYRHIVVHLDKETLFKLYDYIKNKYDKMSDRAKFQIYIWAEANSYEKLTDDEIEDYRDFIFLNNPATAALLTKEQFKKYNLYARHAVRNSEFTIEEIAQIEPNIPQGEMFEIGELLMENRYISDYEFQSAPELFNPVEVMKSFNDITERTFTFIKKHHNKRTKYIETEDRNILSSQILKYNFDKKTLISFLQLHDVSNSDVIKIINQADGVHKTLKNIQSVLKHLYK